MSSGLYVVVGGCHGFCLRFVGGLGRKDQLVGSYVDGIYLKRGRRAEDISFSFDFSMQDSCISALIGVAMTTGRDCFQY